MKIAFVSTLAATPWGGCEELWAATAARALAAGHQVLLMTYRWPQRHPRIEALVQQGARVDERPTDRYARRSWVRNTFLNPFARLIEFAPDVTLINQAATYDISYRGEMNALRKTLARHALPYVLVCHCEESPPPSWRRLRRARIAFGAATIAGFLSERLRRTTESHLGIALPRARIFQNPLRLGDSGPLPWPRGPILRMAFIGRLERIKGLDILIEILATPTWRARDWNLTLCGSGQEEEGLKEQVRRAGLAQRVHFAGFVDNVTDIWREHQVLVMPSRAEGVPLALLEAMQCARPAVVTDVGGITEWVTAEEGGFVAAHPVLKDIAATLEEMWAARARLQDMGQRAHARLAAQHDADPAGTLLSWLEGKAGHAEESPSTARNADIMEGTRVAPGNGSASDAGLPPIHMFWHGAALSRLERLCIASFLAHGHPVRLHVYQEPSGVPPGVQMVDANRTLPEKFLFHQADSGSVGSFADWFRYQLLYEQGGIWADTDVVCLKPLQYPQPVLFARQDEQIINNAVLALPAGHELAAWMVACCREPNRMLPYDSRRTRRRKLQRRLLQGNRRGNVTWGEYGPQGFTQAARHLGYEARALPYWHFYPVHYLNWRTVFDGSLHDNPGVIAASTTLHLWNEMTRRAPGFDVNARFPADSLFEQLCARYLKTDS
jgi:glycosyltransferase involved in cell wall biosynthesis